MVAKAWSDVCFTEARRARFGGDAWHKGLQTCFPSNHLPPMLQRGFQCQSKHELSSFSMCIFWCSSSGSFLEYSVFLPSFNHLGSQLMNRNRSKCDFNSVKIASWVPHGSVCVANNERLMSCPLFAHSWALATHHVYWGPFRWTLRRIF